MDVARTRLLWVAIGVAIVSIHAAAEPLSSAGKSYRGLPAIMLWAWERPEDLRFLEPGEAGVAAYVRGIRVERSRVQIRSRRNPLRVAQGIAQIAVVRIETRHPELTARQAQEIVANLADLWDGNAFQGLQIDFDAGVGERDFYRGLLRCLREAMPRPWSLSITALGSWCLGDPWIRDLPIEDAVPMLFRMGPDARSIRSALARGGDFSVGIARSSVGLSLDERPVSFPRGRRIYLFNAHAWTKRTYLSMKARLGR